MTENAWLQDRRRNRPRITTTTYNYNPLAYYSRAIVNSARTAMLFNRRRFSPNAFVDSFGGGIRRRGTRRIAVPNRTSPT